MVLNAGDYACRRLYRAIVRDENSFANSKSTLWYSNIFTKCLTKSNVMH